MPQLGGLCSDQLAAGISIQDVYAPCLNMWLALLKDTVKQLTHEHLSTEGYVGLACNCAILHAKVGVSPDGNHANYVATYTTKPIRLLQQKLHNKCWCTLHDGRTFACSIRIWLAVCWGLLNSVNSILFPGLCYK